MGLQDDAARAIDADTELRAKREASDELDRTALRADWTEELRQMIVERGFERQPLYRWTRTSKEKFKRRLIRLGMGRWEMTVNTEYVGSFWLLRGWDEGGEYGPNSREAIMDVDGGILMTPFRIIEGQAESGRMVTRVGSGPNVTCYPDVTASRDGIFALTSGPLSRPYTTAREEVGVRIASALLQGANPTKGVIEGRRFIK